MSKLTSQALIIAMTALMALFLICMADLPAQSEALSALTILTIGLSLVLERVRPYDPKWNKNQGDLAGDIASFGLVFVALDGLLKYLAPILVIALLGGLTATSIHLPISLPLWAEIIAVTLLIELAAYLSHWIHHRYRPLWALHAMHHSVERLYTLNNFRFHPLNHVLNAFAIVVPPLLLGFSEAAVLGYVALSMPVLVFQHTNIDLRFGRLNYLFNTNEVHRWHHSIGRDEGPCNLGRALTIWDQVFRTFFYPHPNGTAPIKVGLADDNLMQFPAATDVLAQWRYPFTAACCSFASTRT